MTDWGRDWPTPMADGLGNEDGRPTNDGYRALSNPTVRYVLRHLHRHPTASLDELADVVAGAEAAAAGGVVDADRRDRLRLYLHHVTIPRLEAVGYVEYDLGDRTVARIDVPPSVYALLGIDDEDDPPAAEHR